MEGAEAEVVDVDVAGAEEGSEAEAVAGSEAVEGAGVAEAADLTSEHLIKASELLIKAAF